MNLPILISKLKGRLSYRTYLNLSFSQEGEDLLLNRLLRGQEKGFYVDVGAHHPQRFSNTYKFYLLGWQGINIDPLPGTMEKFHQLRPRDVNLELAISDEEQELTYYIFDEPALNTFDAGEVQRKAAYDIYPVSEKKIPTRKLADTLDQYVPPGQVIDFLSVDVEGLDLAVLQSNNWEKYRPRLIVVEELWSDLEKLLDESKLLTYLDTKGYSLLCKMYNSVIYKPREDHV